MNYFTSILKNTCPRAKAMLYLPHDRNERSTHDGRRSSSILTSSGMEPIQEKEARERVFLCQEVASWRCLPWPCYQSRRDHRRPSLGETSQGSLKNKATNRWQWTTKNLVAADLSLMDATPEEISLSTRLPFFSIHSLLPYDKVWCMRMRVRVESVYVPMDGRSPKDWTPQEREAFIRDYESRQIRDYDRSKVTNIFAISEQIEWVRDLADTSRGTLAYYQTGIIKKITPWTILLEVDGKDQREDKSFLADAVRDNSLEEAIKASFGQDPSKKPKNTPPHDAYRLRDPRDKAVFYVGISKNVQRRFKQHLACAGLNFKLNIRIQEILQSGLIPELELIERAIPGPDKAREREKFWINHHTQLGDILTNIAEMNEVE